MCLRRLLDDVGSFRNAVETKLHLFTLSRPPHNRYDRFALRNDVTGFNFLEIDKYKLMFMSLTAGDVGSVRKTLAIDLPF
jgi:hypothetical protein